MAIVPELTEPLTAPYWAAAARGELVTQHCLSCDRIWHPPLPRCPHCHATGTDWRPVSGKGTVYAYTVVEHATHVAMREHVPYVVAIVELAEGPRVVTNIRGCLPGDVRVGMPVRVAFERLTPAVTLPQFVPG
jgi:uncharacterized protein